jgi:hypothetical protein
LTIKLERANYVLWVGELRGLKMLKLKRILIVFVIGLLLLLSQVKLSYAEVEIVEKDSPAPIGGIILDDESSGKILLDVQKLPILEETIKNLESQVATLKLSGGNFGQQVANLEQTIFNLKQMVEYYKQLLEIEKQRTSLYKERSEFYIEQGKSKDQLFDQQQKLIAELTKEVKKKSLWQSLALGELFVIIGIAIGIVL